MGDQGQEDEVGETYSIHGGDQKCIDNFSRKTWKEDTTCET